MLKFFGMCVLVILVVAGTLRVLSPREIDTIGPYVFTLVVSGIAWPVIVVPTRRSVLPAIGFTVVGALVALFLAPWGLWVCLFGLGLLITNLVIWFSQRGE